MRHSPEDKPAWNRATILSVAVILLLGAAGIFALVGVFYGWIEPPPDPKGTYPPAAGYSPQ